MICEACKSGNHDQCAKGDCECPTFLEEKKVQEELAAVSRADYAFCEAILSNVQYSGSAVARMIIEGAGREQTKLFINQVLVSSRAMRS